MRQACAKQSMGKAELPIREFLQGLPRDSLRSAPLSKVAPATPSHVQT